MFPVTHILNNSSGFSHVIPLMWLIEKANLALSEGRINTKSIVFGDGDPYEFANQFLSLVKASSYSEQEISLLSTRFIGEWNAVNDNKSCSYEDVSEDSVSEITPLMRSYSVPDLSPYVRFKLNKDFFMSKITVDEMMYLTPGIMRIIRNPAVTIVIP